MGGSGWLVEVLGGRLCVVFAVVVVAATVAAVFAGLVVCLAVTALSG